MPDHTKLAIARWPLARDQAPPRTREQLFPGMRAETWQPAVGRADAPCKHGYHECATCKPNRRAAAADAQPECPEARKAGLPAGWHKDPSFGFNRDDKRASVWPSSAGSWVAGAPCGPGNFSPDALMGEKRAAEAKGHPSAADAARFADEQIAAKERAK